MYGLFELIRHKKEETQMRIFPIVAVWIAGHLAGAKRGGSYRGISQ